MDKRLPPDEYFDLKRQCFERDRWRCRHCGRREGLHCHHIVFRSRGGLDMLSNLITICFHEHNEVHQEKLWLEGDANGKVLATRIACPEGYLI